MPVDHFFASPGSGHWIAMWDWLAKHPYNVDLGEPIVAACEGECWQYMGTDYEEGRWFDVFRHRYHPRRQDRVYLRRPLPDFVPPHNTDNTDNTNANTTTTASSPAANEE